jgi:tetratricopeptide (TPR) repeat protein
MTGERPFIGKLNSQLTIPLDVAFRRVVLLHEQAYLEPARQLAMDLVKHAPEHLPTLLALADTLRELGRFDEALAVLRRVGQLEPNNTRATAAVALTLFYKQDWARAWRAYEVRFKLIDPPQVTRLGPGNQPVPVTLWRGGSAPTSLLVMTEQGLGDTIQFVRFLPAVAAAGTKVTLVAPSVLFPLLGTLDAPIEFLPSDKSGSVPGIKAWTPLMHLPQALGLDRSAEGLTTKIPYLRAEPERIARRRAQIGTAGFKVGISWQGNPDKRIDNGRSAPLAAFAPLAAIPGVRLINLQKGDAANEISSVPFAEKIEIHNSDIDVANDGFRETAAIVECLDLTITVDTAIGHLAGALGRPTLIMLKRLGTDWRWLFNRENTVWYPTVQLMRQVLPGDWNELLGRVAELVRRRAT